MHLRMLVGKAEKSSELKRDLASDCVSSAAMKKKKKKKGTPECYDVIWGLAVFVKPPAIGAYVAGLSSFPLTRSSRPTNQSERCHEFYRTTLSSNRTYHFHSR